jgi:hypothetical protein
VLLQQGQLTPSHCLLLLLLLLRGLSRAAAVGGYFLAAPSFNGLKLMYTSAVAPTSCVLPCPLLCLPRGLYCCPLGLYCRLAGLFCPLPPLLLPAGCCMVPAKPVVSGPV